MNYHKIHFAVLGQVLDAVLHAKAIQTPAREFARNIADFAQECDRVKFEALKIPVDPFEDSPELYEQVRALRDPKVAEAMTRYLWAYRDAVQRALAAAQSCQDVRERIDSESQPLLQQLNAALDAFPQANAADAVAKLAAMQDVQFMTIRLSTLLPQAERAIDAPLAHLAVAKENIDAIMQ